MNNLQVFNSPEFGEIRALYLSLVSRHKRLVQAKIHQLLLEHGRGDLA